MPVSSAVSSKGSVTVSGDLVRRRPELAHILVHALAELPDRVIAELPEGLEDREQLELLARAYAIDERLTFQVAGAGSRGHPVDALLERGSFAQVVEGLRDGCEGSASVRCRDEVFRGQRVAVVTNIPTHYRIPLLNEMASRLEAVECAFHVFFLAQLPRSRSWMRPIPINFQHDFVHGLDLRRDAGRRVLPFNLGRELLRYAPTQILTAGFSPLVSGAVARYSARTGVPFGLWSGEIGSRPTARGRLRRSQRQRLARQASYGVAYGSAAAAYLRGLRRDLPVVVGRNTTPLPPMRTPTRSKTVEVLAVSRAEREKGLDVAIEAVRLDQDIPCRLTVIGDGPERKRLERLASGDPRISIRGAVPSDEIGAAIAKADVFLFPSSYDVFGLVLVEAMAAGLATIARDRPGAVADLCVSGVNSIVIASGETRLWSEALRGIVIDHTRRDALGAAAAASIRSRWTIAHAADAIIAGFRIPILERGER
jgi:glycosyltransferase involved in cell wall biosynthesis